MSDWFTKPKVGVEAHRDADTDVEPSSIHHTLGLGANQAAPGNHNHDSEVNELIKNYLKGLERFTALAVPGANVPAVNTWSNVPIWYYIHAPISTGYIGATGAFVINDPGYWQIHFAMGFTPAAGLVRATRLLIGGVARAQNNMLANNVHATTSRSHWEGNIGAGVQVLPQVWQDAGPGLVIDNLHTYIFARKLSDTYG